MTQQQVRCIKDCDESGLATPVISIIIILEMLAIGIVQ